MEDNPKLDKKMFIFDFETMGTDIEANDFVVIDCSISVFNTKKMLSDNPYTTKSIVDMKRLKLSVKDQTENYNWKVYDDTVKFWEKQSPEAQKHIYPRKSDITVSDFTKEVLNYLNENGKIDYWWSRSNHFDPTILYRLFNSQNKGLYLNEYLPHWKMRDTRTYIDAKLDFPIKNAFIPISDTEFWGKVFEEHNSTWDILADILRIQAILRAENDLEMVKR